MDGLKEAAAGGEGKGGGRQNMRKRRRKWIYGGAMVRKGDGVFYPNNNTKGFLFLSPCFSFLNPFLSPS
ncbi:hypothetical protein BVRB_7g172840 isoform B [Beta vulgaris subsp. vulgaris]|nr:hypothetical protein BVRB_7g172840 isoform B [Beta vulgaris subsp. vulgaris]